MTKDQLERENAELRGEVETLRYQLRLMTDAHGLQCQSMTLQLEAQRKYTEILTMQWAPTTLHD